MTSVLSHWLSAKALFFCYISAIPPGWSGGFLTPLQYILLSSLSNRNLHTPTYTYTNCISFIPPHIPTLPEFHLSCLSFILPLIYPASHLSCLSFILPLIYPASHLSCLSFIPTHIPTQSASHLPSYMYLHSQHLIYSPTNTYTNSISIIPQHIPTQPASHLSPRFNS